MFLLVFGAFPLVDFQTAEAVIVETFDGAEGPVSNNGWGEYFAPWGADRAWTLGRGSAPNNGQYVRDDRSTGYAGEQTMAKAFPVNAGSVYQVSAWIRHNPDKTWADGQTVNSTWFEILAADGNQTAQYMAENSVQEISRITELDSFTATWVQVSADTTATTGTELTIALKNGHSGSSVGIPHIDEIDLTELTAVYEWSLY
jgi:hypothetical protein